MTTTTYSVEKYSATSISERAYESANWPKMREECIKRMRYALDVAGCLAESIHITEPEHVDGYYTDMGEWIDPHWEMMATGFAEH